MGALRGCLELSWLDARVGLSSENLWLGPALRYPLLLSSAGPGFPHLYLQAPTVDLGIATLELAAFLGRLSESGYYDADRNNDYRSLSGFALVFQPGSGLTLGGGVLRHRRSERVPPLRDLFAFATSPFAYLRGRDENDNGLMSMFVNWDHPASGLSVYLEWGREDFFYDLNDLLTNPDHSRGYTLGLTKTASLGNRDVLLVVELTQLASSPNTWYISGDVLHGHTHRGQLLGAWVGPGSEGQYASVDVTGRGGPRWSAYLERIRWDDATYRYRFFTHYGFRGHDVEIRTGLGHGRPLGPLLLDASFGIAFRRNREFLDLERWEFRWGPEPRTRRGAGLDARSHGGTTLTRAAWAELS